MKIKSIEKIEHDSLRYDIEVKDNHNFFANGMLVHNSCGILWNFQGQYGITTRGSFTSEQAIWATDLLNTRYAEQIKQLNCEDYTFVFEIVYPENRIVVNYGDFADLIMIAVIDKRTGEDLCLTDAEIEMYKSYGFNFVQRYPEYDNLDFDFLKSLNLHNKEGFVLQFESGERVKLKFDDYCRLHSIITNITYRDIWDTLRQGKSVVEILENVPDEFDEWVNDKIKTLNDGFAAMYSETVECVMTIRYLLNTKYTKKKFAEKNLEINKGNPSKIGLVFAYENGQDIADSIWNKLYPHHEKAFSSKFNADEEL